MNPEHPTARFHIWRSERLFQIDFARYSLSHHQFPKHFHQYFVIEFVMYGADRFYCNGKNYTATDNQLVLINPGEVHTGATVAHHPLHYFSLCPGQKSLQDLASLLEIHLPNDFCFPRAVNEDPEWVGKFRLLSQSFIENSDPLLQEELFFDCMRPLLAAAIGSSPPVCTGAYDRRLENLCDFLQTNFIHEISLQSMSALINLDPFHLLRLFKRRMGMTPYDYVLTLRTDKARGLLRNGANVQTAALSSGFYDASHLNRAFKRIYAVSPVNFRLSKSQYRTNFLSLDSVALTKTPL